MSRNSNKNVNFDINIDANVSSSLKKAQQQIKSVEKNIKGINQENIKPKVSEKTQSGLSKLKKQIIAIGAAIGAIELGSSFIQLGADMEQTRTAFATLIGSVEEGNKTLAELEKFSRVTPFSPDQVNKAGKSMIAFGEDTKTLIPTLQKIGDISAGTGKNFNELALIYGKAKVAGKLYAEDINQLVEAGIPIMDQFAKRLGVSTAEVKKMASEGKLDFKILEDSFTEMTSKGGKFFDMMGAQSKTVAGRWSTLKGTFVSVATQLSEKMLPIMGKIVDTMSMLLEWSIKNADILKILGTVILGVTTGYGVYNVVMSLSTLHTKIFTAAQKALNVVMALNPIGLVIAGLAALVTGLVIAYKESKKFRAMVDGTWAAIKQLGANIMSLVSGPLSFLKNVFNNIIDMNFEGLIGNVKTLFSKIGKMFVDFIKSRLNKTSGRLECPVAPISLF